MKFRHFALSALLASIGVAQAAPVTLLASDDFSYGSLTSGTVNLAGKNGGTGWSGAWTGSSVAKVVNTTAADVGMSGGAFQVSGNNNSVATRQLGTAISKDAFVEFFFQVDAGAIDQNDFLGLWFGNSSSTLLTNYSGPNMGLKGNCDQASGCASDLFVRTTGSAGKFTTPLTVGSTVHLVGLLEKTGTSNVYNKYSLWVNPSAHEFSTLTGADAVFTGASGLSSFNTIGFRSANLDANDRLLVDQLRIGVIPEPAALGLLGVAFLGASLASRRNKKV